MSLQSNVENPQWQQSIKEKQLSSHKKKLKGNIVYLPAGIPSWFPRAGKIGVSGKILYISSIVSLKLLMLSFFVWFQISCGGKSPVQII